MKHIHPHHAGLSIVFSCLLAVLMAASARAQTSPQRVLIIGDSMMRVTAHATELALANKEGVTAQSFTSLGSGLARLDVFDWMAKIEELVAGFHPQATLVWFGTNDRQPLKTPDGIRQPGTPDWDAEYGRRVGQAMDMLTAEEGARVYWLELPDMRDAKMQEDVDLINQLVKTEADKRPQVEFVATRSILGRKPGTYSAYVIGEGGLPLQIRDADGVHLNRAGADRLADFMTKKMFDAN